VDDLAQAFKIKKKIIIFAVSLQNIFVCGTVQIA
jgi:hypothetical protein